MSSIINSSPEAISSTIAALGSLNLNLGQFRGEVTRRMHASMSELEEARSRTLSKIDALRVERECEDENPDPVRCYDLDALMRRAEEELDVVERLSARGKKLLVEAVAAESRAMMLVDLHIPRLITRAKQGLKSLSEFQSLSLGGTNSWSDPANAGTTSGDDSRGTSVNHYLTPAPNLNFRTPNKLELVTTPLPEGFKWISVDNIVQSAGYSEENLDFNNGRRESKAGYMELMQRFLGEVLPVMQESARPREVLEKIDIQENRHNVDAAGNVYDLLFGGEPIKVSQISEGFTLDSGRHRVWAARVMGWTHVPAKS